MAFEKVNPSHVDKLADRIAGSIVDLAYKKNKRPKVAVEVLIGHNTCHIINETDTHLTNLEVKSIVYRIVRYDNVRVDYKEVKQDKHLAKNQSKEIRCGDNGIFKGVPITQEQKTLIKFVKDLYKLYPYDGKFIIHDNNELIICQSHASSGDLANYCLKQKKLKSFLINPIGDWSGGTNVDTGATNRKLGSDMGDAVTGGGLHGKDLSKADVSVNIYCHLLAQKYNKEVKAYCAIGDKEVMIDVGNGWLKCTQKYKDIVKDAKTYIKKIGGFEKLAEWGLIR